MTAASFRKIIYSHYEKEGRVLPWRLDTGAWGVMVSEFMLQQTRIERVIPYWERWLRRWPSPAALAAASLEEALAEWSGLGYNRRCRCLRECARLITKNLGGKVPALPAELQSLPGIGPYAAGAIACFAYNYPAVFIETNIRTVMLHFYFQDREDVYDREIFPLLEKALDRKDPRKWNWALMDYGAALKKIAPNPSRRSAHYTRQSPFKGSLREVRGAIVKTLAGQGRQGAEALYGSLEKNLEGLRREDFYRAIDALKNDMMVAETGGIYRIRETP